MLQSFALQHVFQKNNIPFECVRFIPKFSFKTFFSKIPLFFIKSARKMKMEMLSKSVYLHFMASRKMKDSFLQRNLKFDEFSQRNFFESKELHTHEELREYSKSLKSVILGSDQVLHPINLGAHFYDLSWVDESVPKYAYASSFGVSKIPLIQKSYTKRYLSRFAKMSLREKSGVEIVQSLTGKNYERTLDPTLLLCAQEWSEVFHLTSSASEQPYIFCYFLGKNKKHREFAKELQKKTGYRIINPVHLDSYNPEDDSFGDEHPFNVGPSEFVQLIKGASYVCTDSFHGTVFSLLFAKKVAVFNRYNVGSSASANSRIQNLFDLAQIENNVKTVDDLIRLAPLGCSFDEKIMVHRAKSLEYLQKIAGSN
ncbi:polysaccharide pyruvyl transferase family protein [Fibrobacter sp. UWB11]|uniref:polysaccharide pyruvyl transferase family protein n=1 Tax=Fibrobacter sp. UWB11 TaxID=1896202 RepID=UPI001588137B|nr:polysaccharide pyruvyl transferase family protein [Fibrobacter sp. UWB11]